jgi:hypothetical protein
VVPGVVRHRESAQPPIAEHAVDLHSQKTTSQLTEIPLREMLQPCEMHGDGCDLVKLSVAWAGNDAEV